MSSKTRTTTTKEEPTPALVPKLRFPEFRNAEGWKDMTLGQMGAFLRGLTYTPGDVAEKGLLVLRSGNIQDGSLVFDKDLVFVEKACDPDLLLRGGDVVICMSNGSKALVGKSAEFRQDYSGEITIGAFCSLYRPRNPFSKIAFRSEPYSDVIADSIMGGNINNLKNSTLEGFPFPIPPTPAEQRKIAECLSSVDEVIAAQARKVDALKAHKKGLMQQLFPRQGETQPRLRFPEFQNAGEWVAQPLGEVFPITSSKRVHESDWTAAGVPFYRAREIVALNKQEPIQPLFISEELYSEFSKLTGEIREGHLLVTGVGSIGVPYLVKKGDRFYFKDGNIIWLKNDEKELSGEFLHRLYETDYVQKQLKTMADVGTVATYTIDNAKRTLAVYPPDPAEQERIASCLSSLDALITAETQKHEALKLHKKGLMQQLFPSPEEVEG